MARRTNPSSHPATPTPPHDTARAVECGGHAVECGSVQENGSPPPHARPRCHALTRKGLPCRFPARKGTGFCINHEPGADTRNAAARASAAAAARRIPAEHLLDAAFSLSDRAGVQALLDATLRLAIARRIPATTVDQVFRGCALAIRNFDAAPETLTGPQPQSHDLPRHFALVRGFLASVQPILAEADEADAAIQEAYREALQ